MISNLQCLKGNGLDACFISMEMKDYRKRITRYVYFSNEGIVESERCSIDGIEKQ